MVRARGAALAARLSCGARSLGIERSWWRREWSERELITLVTGYNVSMFAALCRGGRLSVRGAVSVGLCCRTIVLLRQPNPSESAKSHTSTREATSQYHHTDSKHRKVPTLGLSPMRRRSPCLFPLVISST